MVKNQLFLLIYSAILAFFISLAAGFGRLSPIAPIRWFTIGYVELFRGSSLLVQMFFLYYVLPQFGILLPKLLAGVIALAMNYGAYGSEIVRSSILAIPKDQTEASIALNMTPFQRMFRVILPQAFMIMIPQFGNLIIELLKGTALVSLITLADLTFQATTLRANYNSETAFMFGALLAIYFVIAHTITLGMRWLEQKVTVGRS